IVGFGIGANVGLLYADSNPEVAAIALVLPGFGCSEIDTANQLNDLNARPALLIETETRNETDISRVFRRLAEIRKDAPREQVVLARDPQSRIKVQASGLQALDEKILGWLVKNVPVSKS